jgi:hypothetical protein
MDLCRRRLHDDAISSGRWVDVVAGLVGVVLTVVLSFWSISIVA